MTQDPGDWEGLVPALRGVGEALGSFTLSHGGGDGRRRELRSLVREYLVPRLLDPDSALVVAVVGGSGSGKSTLLNSLARRRISPSGPLRPTTTAPVVWSAEGLPPTLGGFPSLLAGRGIVADPPPPEGLVLVDTPPPSVVGESGRAMAATVLEAADACLFVASGIRYADAAGWDLIGLAARRRLPSLFVLNRLSGVPEIQHLLQEDFTRRLVSRGVLRGQGREGVVGVVEGPILPETRRPPLGVGDGVAQGARRPGRSARPPGLGGRGRLGFGVPVEERPGGPTRRPRGRSSGLFGTGRSGGGRVPGRGGRAGRGLAGGPAGPAGRGPSERPGGGGGAARQPGGPRGRGGLGGPARRAAAAVRPGGTVGSRVRRPRS